jgi:hypothetical protein
VVMALERLRRNAVPNGIRKQGMSGG